MKANLQGRNKKQQMEKLTTVMIDEVTHNDVVESDRVIVICVMFVFAYQVSAYS